VDVPYAEVLSGEQLAAQVRRHKQEIIEAIQDDDLERTGHIQCGRHAFEMARNWMEN
jgi:hypothetical protein